MIIYKIDFQIFGFNLLHISTFSIHSSQNQISATQHNQIAIALKEARHGLFSYFLMRRLDGEADTNHNKEITLQELHDDTAEQVLR